MLGQCHDNQETKTCFDIVETTSTSRQKLSSSGLEHERKIFSFVDPLNLTSFRPFPLLFVSRLSDCSSHPDHVECDLSTSYVS